MSHYGQLFKSPEHVLQALDGVDYLCDEAIATACFLAGSMERPLYLEGEAGVGKTSLAHAVSRAFDLPVYRLQCYEGIDITQALYDWDFRKQLLFLKSHENAEPGGPTQSQDLYDRRFLVERPILKAFEHSPCILLIDEIDRADDEFEAFLLEALSEFSITIPEFGTIRPKISPLVFLTSNRTREIHDALKRRCLYHWMEHPGRDQELSILHRKFPKISELLAQDLVAAVQSMRQAGLLKSPGVAETLDWANALDALEVKALDKRVMDLTLGAVLKYREDQDHIRQDGYASALPTSRNPAPA